MTTSRRNVLRAPLAAAAVGVGGLTATGAVALYTQTSDHNTPQPAHLRGTVPQPYAQVIALDLASSEHRAEALHAARDAVTAIDSGKNAAWLALGDSILPGSTSKPRHLKQMRRSLVTFWIHLNRTGTFCCRSLEPRPRSPDKPRRGQWTCSLSGECAGV